MRLDHHHRVEFTPPIGLRIVEAFDYEGLHNLLLKTTTLEHEPIGEKSNQEEE